MAKSAFDGGELLAIILRLPTDIVLVTFASFISLCTAVIFNRTPHAHAYKYFLQDSDYYDVISVSLFLIGVIGCAQLALVSIRVRGVIRLNFNKYVFSLVIFLMAEFIVGIMLSNLKTKISDILESNMKVKLRQSIVAQRSLGVGYRQSEIWDVIQIQMMCCGVDSYMDYVQDNVQAKDQPVPMSCCVMKPTLTTDGALVADNPSQCLLDASHRLKHSIFLHVQGCLSPLSRWMTSYVSRITTFMFGSICIQAITLLYLSWQGYQRHNALTWR